MLKICGASVCRSLKIIFKSCLDRGKFPKECKKTNAVPVYKERDKKLGKNYCPISLLLTCGNVFELILYNSLFNLLNQNHPIYSAQSGLKLGDYYINQINCYQ